MKKKLYFLHKLWIFLLPLLTFSVKAFSAEEPVSLYTHVQIQLQQYYNRSDFADPNHSSGWYRVNDFLTWLQENHIQLSHDLRAHKDILKSNQTLWIYLGARYIASIYQVSNLAALQIQSCNANDPACALYDEKTILYDSSSHKSIASAITLGMHEGTHLLPAFTNQADKGTLSELACFYSQHQYGLPVKIEDAILFSYGIRDFRLTSQRKSFAIAPLSYEYLLHIIGLKILPELSPKLLITNYNTPGSNVNLSTGIIHWYAITKEQLTSHKKPYTKEQYLQQVLGKLSKEEVIYNQSKDFLDSLIDALPQSVLSQLDSCLPVELQDANPCPETLSHLYQDSGPVVRAVLQALQTEQVPPSPPIPPGYL